MGTDAVTSIASFIWKDESLRAVLARAPEVVVLPFQGSATKQLVVIGCDVTEEQLNHVALWNLTLPLLRRLKEAGRLEGFEAAEVIACAIVDGRDLWRVLKFGATPDAIDRLDLATPCGLIDMEQTDDAFCFWYIDPSTIPGLPGSGESSWKTFRSTRS